MCCIDTWIVLKVIFYIETLYLLLHAANLSNEVSGTLFVVSLKNLFETLTILFIAT